MEYKITERKVPAYLGGELSQFYAESGGVVKKCYRLALVIFERQAEIAGKRDEKIWAVLRSAVADALNPSSSMELTEQDQQDAFHWFSSDIADESLDLIGLDAEWVRNVIQLLSEPTGAK